MNNRGDFLRGLIGAAGLAMLAACTHGVEDPRRTKRFTVFLSDLLAGRDVSGEVTARVNAALTPDGIDALRRRYAPLGGFRSLHFLGQDEVQGYDRYHYLATFEHGTQGMLFVLDSSGKIAGFFNE